MFRTPFVSIFLRWGWAQTSLLLTMYIVSVHSNLTLCVCIVKTTAYPLLKYPWDQGRTLTRANGIHDGTILSISYSNHYYLYIIVLLNVVLFFICSIISSTILQNFNRQGSLFKIIWRYWQEKLYTIFIISNFFLVYLSNSF